MSDIIKPCPFCGSAAVRLSDLVCCSKCPANSHITSWNNRVVTTATPLPNTVRARVAVSVSPDGTWGACGGSMFADGEVPDICQHEPGDRLVWLVRDIPLPEPAAEIEAEIEP